MNKVIIVECVYRHDYSHVIGVFAAFRNAKRFARRYRNSLLETDGDEVSFRLTSWVDGEKTGQEILD